MDEKFLQGAVRLYLKDSSTLSTADQRDPPQSGDALRRKLISDILFTRKFILTYHITILGIILLLSVLHWSRKFLRGRRRRILRRQTTHSDVVTNEDQDVAKIVRFPYEETNPHSLEISSSGSSTTATNSCISGKDVDSNEETPLLRKATNAPGDRNPLWSSIKALLVYQPAPIPLINKALPSNGRNLAVLCFLSLNIFYCLFRIEFKLYYIVVIANRFGVVFVANLPILYILATKNQPIKFLIGCSYESLNIFHRRLGELLCLLALLHGIGMTIAWYTLIRRPGITFAHYLFSPDILLGLGAFLSYEILYLTSLGSFRRRWYEVFLGMHISLQVAALIFVYFHHSIGQPYVLIALAIFLVDRLIYRYGLKSNMLTATAKLMEDEETVKLSVRIPLQSKPFRISRLLGKSITAGWKPTDHVFVTVDALGKEHLLQAHPFTIFSAAPTGEGKEGILELLIRSQTGFSRDLLHYVHRHKTLSLRLDGPYGSAHAREILEDSELAVIVAGGSGIAVGWPLVEHLVYLSTLMDTESGQSSNLITTKKIILIWIIHQAAHLSWLSVHDLEMARLRGVEIMIPKPTEEVGRPDLKYMIGGIVANYGKRRRIGVVASGPDSMGRLVRNTCSDLVKRGEDIGVVIEKFGW